MSAAVVCDCGGPNGQGSADPCTSECVTARRCARLHACGLSSVTRGGLHARSPPGHADRPRARDGGREDGEVRVAGGWTLRTRRPPSRCARRRPTLSRRSAVRTRVRFARVSRAVRDARHDCPRGERLDCVRGQPAGVRPACAGLAPPRRRTCDVRLDAGPSTPSGIRFSTERGISASTSAPSSI